MQALQPELPQTKTNIDILKVDPPVGNHLIDEQLLELPMEDAQVIIHIIHRVCHPECVSLGACGICINRNVFLNPNKNWAKCVLIHVTHAQLLSAEGLTPKNEVTRFSLIFSGMPKSATRFNFIEPCDRGWCLSDIERNKSDVYVLKIHKSNVTLIA